MHAARRSLHLLRVNDEVAIKVTCPSRTSSIYALRSIRLAVVHCAGAEMCGYVQGMLYRYKKVADHFSESIASN